VSVPDPPWMNAKEDGVLSVHSKRSRTPVQMAATEAPVRPAEARMEVPVRTRIEFAMTMLTEMGILEVYGRDLCRFMLDRHEGDIDRAVDGLTALGRASPQ
jgi:hypothetical protein